MQVAELDYELPDELIAQFPTDERASARLLVVGRNGDELRHATVAELPGLLRGGDLLVLNDARVVPARVCARRPSGGRLELLFVRPAGVDGEWDVLVRGAPRVGERVHLPHEAAGEWAANSGDGRWRLRIAVSGGVLAWLERAGEIPLPPYIRRPDGPTAADGERYQTTYARVPGAVAAPTAGLHLTTEVLARLADSGIETAFLTLHVGPGTFRPIRSDALDEHAMEPERYDIPPATVERIGRVRETGGRVVAVGTTTVRALETAARAGTLASGCGETSLFIRPGHRFAVVDALLTNFHLPRSTLLALVAAFAGLERVRRAYAEAVRLRYRFYSFGDAMLIA